MAMDRTIKLVLGISVVIWILGTCNADFTPADNYLINCGSMVDATVGQRVFVADNSGSTILTSPQSIAAITSSNSVSSFDDAALYQTSRIFTAPSSYSFKIKSRGRHFVRLYFFPFRYQSYDLATANFKVSTQDVVLLNSFSVPSSSPPVFKEYSLNITRDMLILTFVPLGNSTPLSFINAIEVISVPDNLITDSAQTVDPVGQYLGLSTQPMQTFYRVNVGGPKVTAENDTLWRTWAIDQSFFLNSTATRVVNYSGKLNYQRGLATLEDAPDSVYNTARQLAVQNNTSSVSNMTWQFNVDGRSSYLIRFHFCDIVSKAAYQLYFDVYVDSWSASKDLDLSTLGFSNLAVPYYMDIVLLSSDLSGKLSVSIGPSSLKNAALDGILNGLEIMKMNISTGTVDIVAPPSVAKRHLAVILGSALGVVAAVIIATVICIFFRRKKKPQPPSTSRPSSSWTPLNGLSFLTTGSRTTSRTTLTSGTTSDTSYRIPFVVLQDATNHFDEQMVIGVGGFGKVYKAVMQDGSKVAVKRGNQKSHQGLREFQTEIELLSGLRHRHLVSLIGYCDEHNEMILVYEYMEKGTLKSHLYGSEMPPLSWKKRLEICIGSARGLHYLHTGFAKSIIHRDVKSANILLDECLLAKVSDFGLSKVGPEFDQTHVSTAVKGSFGYLDPEYFRRQKLTDKSDVYSFGVVLLEVICARPVIDPTLPRDMINLAEWAVKWQKRGQLDQIVDQRIAGTIRPEALRKFGETVEKCLAEYGVERPTMGDVLWNLEFVLQLQEAGPDISKIDSMNQISELPSNTKRVSSLDLSTAVESRMPIDYSDMSTSNAFSQLINAEGR
ncbi:receptor-like protein kinase HERK 1 [Phragmites australis]|uniref:receptor-like protein kinase HERK 1 n=1 Tax=Phragmites australis TaxID=29695 RepID=UPI002D776E87|nr:receptor-like protein kinase HERK 1 [Phragmites australis]